MCVKSNRNYWILLLLVFISNGNYSEMYVQVNFCSLVMYFQWAWVATNPVCWIKCLFFLHSDALRIYDLSRNTDRHTVVCFMQWNDKISRTSACSSYTIPPLWQCEDSLPAHTKHVSPPVFSNSIKKLS